MKTNVLRHLDALKIGYETKEYAVEDEQFDGMHAAEMTAPSVMIDGKLVVAGQVPSKKQMMKILKK